MSNKNRFKKQPMCEVCGMEHATSFSYFQTSKIWKFSGACTTDNETYYIEIERFFKSPGATVDWLAHMNEKEWMDWGEFMKMMDRFRQATGSFFQT